MKALLLAAGLGTRLRPITNTIPKCLVPINGKPLLEYWLENLSKAGINEFLINTHYFSEQVELYVNNSIYKDKVTLIYEKKLLNTAGTILANKHFFGEEAFLLVHADNLCFCNFTDFLKSHNQRPSFTDITMMLFKTDNPSSCGIVELDKNNVVQKFHEKVLTPPSNLANAAVYICDSSVINTLISLNKQEIDFSLEILPRYLGKINTYLNDVYLRDIGTIENYAKAQVDIMSLIDKKEST